MIRTAILVALTLTCTSAFADGLSATHRDNQKVGSAVASYWRSVRAPEQPKDFTSVHNDNQKIGSAIVEFWTSYIAVPSDSLGAASSTD
ncbi:MAG: hypothetical protein KJ944_07180 [Alphaproteobacteria bacterium]|nr:hypothetical protein [Alphaproteobacteria bacterium]MBU1561653.1 hypothetical protein [Alphaproteobacteria bacterium]MBU2302366.1 hypothetical protein [Alphaproteobacteria bacterium]MBU2368646.1 hypothetical protein [Alphaproteobacteria bacterium]